MKIEYAIIIKNKTRLESLIERFNTKVQAQFYIERLGGNFQDYQDEHDIFYESLEEIQKQLTGILKYKIINRNFVPSFLFSDKHLIITVGQDGLVANTAKYSRHIPILAINADPRRHAGILLPFTTENFLESIKNILKNQSQSRSVHLAKATLNDGQELLAFNELFIGISSHISAHYKITYRDSTENHSSSGLIVSTKSGTTGWLSSFFNMTNGILNAHNHDITIPQPNLSNNELIFMVREPFQSPRTQTGIVTGNISNSEQLIIESLMTENGVIFSDGIENDFIKFNSGAIATITLAEETAILIQPS